MIIDSSALIAILLKEPEAHRLDQAIVDAAGCRISAGNFLEASMVLAARLGPDGPRNLDLLLFRLRVEIVPFTEQQARQALRVFQKFGKGFHAAGLNFGDCIAYSLAAETGEELLFKGTDFGLTDATVASY